MKCAEVAFEFVSKNKLLSLPEGVGTWIKRFERCEDFPQPQDKYPEIALREMLDSLENNLKELIEKQHECVKLLLGGADVKKIDVYRKFAIFVNGKGEYTAFPFNDAGLVLRPVSKERLTFVCEAMEKSL